MRALPILIEIDAFAREVISCTQVNWHKPRQATLCAAGRPRAHDILEVSGVKPSTGIETTRQSPGQRILLRTWFRTIHIPLRTRTGPQGDGGWSSFWQRLQSLAFSLTFTGCVPCGF